MNSDTSNQLDMHQLSHDQMDRNTRLAQSSLDLNSHVQTFQQHSNSQQHLQQQQHHLHQHPHHQLPSFQSHQSSNAALYNSGQGIGWTIDDSEKRVVGGEDAGEDDVVVVADAVESLNVAGMFEHES
jgi:uncharacterized protein YlxW (UPF0749 family)